LIESVCDNDDDDDNHYAMVATATSVAAAVAAAAGDKALFPLPELTGDRFPLPVNTARVNW